MKRQDYGLLNYIERSYFTSKVILNSIYIYIHVYANVNMKVKEFYGYWIGNSF